MVGLNKRRNIMSTSVVIRKEIRHNGVVYRTDGKMWEAQMFGTYGPSCGGIPAYRFVIIDREKVPREVIAVS
jgi:hypothetical protein